MDTLKHMQKNTRRSNFPPHSSPLVLGIEATNLPAEVSSYPTSSSTQTAAALCSSVLLCFQLRDKQSWWNKGNVVFSEVLWAVWCEKGDPEDTSAWCHLLQSPDQWGKEVNWSKWVAPLPNQWKEPLSCTVLLLENTKSSRFWYKGIFNLHQDDPSTVKMWMGKWCRNRAERVRTTEKHARKGEQINCTTEGKTLKVPQSWRRKRVPGNFLSFSVGDISPQQHEHCHFTKASYPWSSSHHPPEITCTSEDSTAIPIMPP